MKNKAYQGYQSEDIDVQRGKDVSGQRHSKTAASKGEKASGNNLLNGANFASVVSGYLDIITTLYIQTKFSAPNGGLIRGGTCGGWGLFLGARGGWHRWSGQSGAACGEIHCSETMLWLINISHSSWATWIA
ncbi:hypothetical protein Cni_G02076 [Canna indica]|uniref:Uncharacterized protein n=1 Tax=Canna indica TaxID=4628 RepID=A0AAQ3JNJ7_9LILI|nr:hypothetical protein Cni_G02076 [Canna indica]